MPPFPSYDLSVFHYHVRKRTTRIEGTLAVPGNFVSLIKHYSNQTFSDQIHN